MFFYIKCVLFVLVLSISGEISAQEKRDSVRIYFHQGWRSPAKSGSPELICWVQQANTKQFMFRSEIHGNRASVISTR